MNECCNVFLLQEKLVAFIRCAVWIDALLPQRTKGNEYCKIEFQEVRQCKAITHRVSWVGIRCALWPVEKCRCHAVALPLEPVSCVGQSSWNSLPLPLCVLAFDSVQHTTASYLKTQQFRSVRYSMGQRLCKLLKCAILRVLLFLMLNSLSFWCQCASVFWTSGSNAKK